jgi:hypothetical protein
MSNRSQCDMLCNTICCPRKKLESLHDGILLNEMFVVLRAYRFLHPLWKCAYAANQYS